MLPAVMNPSTAPRFSVDQMKELVAELEVPFDPAVIEWRATKAEKQIGRSTALFLRREFDLAMCWAKPAADS